MKKIVLGLVISLFGISGITQTLVSTGDLNDQRWKHQAQVLESGKVLAFGGDSGGLEGRVYYTSSELYNPDTETWTVAAEMNEKRSSFASVRLEDGKVLAIGGKSSSSFIIQSSCEIYDPSTNTWTVTGSMSTERWGHNAVLLNDGKVLVAGGGDDWASAEIFDPITEEWTATEEMAYEHGQYSSLTLMADGKVLCTGGWFADPDGRVADVYDPETNEWTAAPNMVVNRIGNSSILLNDGKVLVYGSSISTTCEIYDPISNTFTTTGSSHNYNAYSKGIKLSDGKVFVYSIGDLFSPGETHDIEIYNPVSGTWSSPSSATGGRGSYKIVALQTGQILIIGGSFAGVGVKSCLLVEGVSVSVPKENYTISTFSIYPNPAKSKISIVLESPELENELTIEIVDFTGRIVQSEIVNSNTILELNINNLVSGIYLCKITGKNNSKYISRFVVE